MKLPEYMASAKLDETAMAARVGCSVSALKKLMRGERKPSLQMAWRVARATRGKVGLADWFNDNRTPMQPAA